MRKSTMVMSILLATATAFSADASETGHKHSTQPYAGFESRQIKSLSDSDLKQLREGSGWGLALPAELNGRPGPAHLLELKDQLQLTPEQVTKIEGLHADMKREAIAAGERFISAERALSIAFETPDLDNAQLEVLLKEAGDARAALRLVHLKRHIDTPPLLTAHQIQRYQVRPEQRLSH
ncbi:conserved hypothetical protein [Roseibium sp. TrichSKD4]|uniref:Spy/CpxP family protein refolding chaperone n=1 Tax=Roseibium sp. TrichSKD4 TaxID=744980 RepID=UPI0001E57465|nr:periplasmic heavy metal sensor [Roseibium sp. TrichSKD4]EFO29275.1 conserved hypothetical protein [Roseibium sp. TrichSKD4]